MVNLDSQGKKHMSRPATIYFPVESKARELASRLLITRSLLPHGHKVVVGFNDTVVSGSRWWPRGVYFLKGMNAVQKRMASIFRRQGYRVIAIDEEALGICDAWFLTKDVDPEIAPLLEIVFCQGGNHLDALAAHRGFTKEQLVESGNPRIDLLKAPLKSTLDKEAAYIKERFGRFILINTNSGSINNIWGDLRRYLGLLVEIGWFDPENADDRALVDDHLEHDRNNFGALRELMENLSGRRPDISVVVRPHPSEGSGVWAEFAEKLSNVTIVSDTEPAPWLWAADIVLTTGCTTGLEAVLLGKPAVSLVAQPDHVRHPGFFIANRISVVAPAVSEAVQLLEDHWDGKVDVAKIEEKTRAAALANHMRVDNGILASDRIAREIAERGFEGADDHRDVAIDPEHENYLRKTIKKVKWEKGSFTAAEIRDWLQLFDSLLGAKQHVEIREMGWSSFELSSPS